MSIDEDTPETRSPRPYREWSEAGADRQEAAANAFGYYLIKHCRDEALADLSSSDSDRTREAVREAVDKALHNVMDLLEGFWQTKTPDDYALEFVLSVRLRDSQGAEADNVVLSPDEIDLPVGYWKWANDRDFR